MRSAGGRTRCSADLVRVSVVYALPDDQTVATLELPAGSTVRQALDAVAHSSPFRELDLGSMPVGIFGRLVERDARLEEGDRVELYRPLASDPREARRRRAKR
jgi:putative ubiquitin-RnfH superfamily antitoxin RatB of RatAB toxin-antitoxin module